MKKVFTSTLAVLVCVISLMAQQQPQIGTPGYVQSQNPNTNTQRGQDPVVQPLNGNDTLTTTYSNTACGLNYCMTSVRLGQRFQPVGLPQPAPMNVSCMPACGTVLKAFLYTEVLGVTPSITATLVDPSNTSTSFPMALIGSSIDVCWGMNGTHIWRADVTSLVTGTGTYSLSGLPVSTSTSGVDVEGATLLIIYADPTASYTGSIQIDDGCNTVAGGALSHTMTGFNVCANSTNASTFMLVGDMQMMGYSIAMNGSPVTQPQWDWWNEISAPTSFTSGQTSCSYTLATGGDCYTLGVAGMYYQSNCSSCTPSQVALNVTATSTTATCGNNGTATCTATGGNGNYTYMWTPGNMTTASVSNLAPGTYTVNVTDGTTCGSATVSVGYSGMISTVNTIGSSCQSGTGSATVSVTGGTAPYTYSWSPSGGTAATATGLVPGSYTCTITDASGCTQQQQATIVNNSSLFIYTWTTPDSCPSPAGMVYTSVSGGNAPYTYQWSNSATTATLTNVAAGTYTVTVTDASGCIITDTASVGYASFSHYTNYFSYAQCGDSVLLQAFSSDPSSTFSWSPAGLIDNPTAAQCMAYTQNSMTFYVTISGTCGTVTDSVLAYVDSVNLYNEQICFVTVDTATNKNLITWERTSSPSGGFYNIYRETSVSGQYTLIASQPIAQYTTYLDVTSNPIVMANRYVITTVDTCGYESDTSLHHRSIHLQVSASPFGGWNLAWTAYEGLNIQTYNIYRGTTISNMTLLTQVAGNVFTYTDITAPPGNVWYMIEAVHPNGGCSPSRWAGPGNNQVSEYNSSLSNLAYTDPVGIDVNSSVQTSLTVSPNPGNGVFVVQCNALAGADVQVTVTDAIGRTVYTSVDENAGGTFRKEMDLSALAPGVYNVQVQNGNGTGITRLVITE